MRIKKFLLQCIVATVSVATFPIFSAEAAQWEPNSQLPRANHTRVNIIDANAAVDRVSRIVVDFKDGEQTLCKKWGETPCDTQTLNDSSLYAFSYVNLPYCEKDQYEFCVEKVFIYKKGEVSRQANYVRAADEFIVPAAPEVNLPYGGGNLIFQAPGVTNGGNADTYAVRANVFYSYIPEKNRFLPVTFSAVVEPYSVDKNVLQSLPSILSGNSTGRFRRWPDREWWYQGSFLANDGSKYLKVSEDFTEGTRVGISVRIPSELGGWFSGRLSDPQIKVESINARTNLLSIDASSVEVPRLSAEVPFEMWDDVHPKNVLPKVKVGTPSIGIQAFATWAQINNGVIQEPRNVSVEWVNNLRNLVQDRAQGRTNVWTLNSSQTFFTNSSCFPLDRFTGLVTTNAVAYSANPPIFKDGYLNYQVSGLHYLPDGSETLGTYDLVLSSSVARCLYGFSDAPVSATISIVGDDGQNRKISTTQVSESGGWLKMAAYGFTFSSPTIRVKINGTPILKPLEKSKSTEVSQTKKVTISCTRGKLVKKVTGTSPKCPTGYKKSR